MALPPHCRSKFQTWLSKLSIEERDAYAERADTTWVMIKCNWLRPVTKPLPTTYTELRPVRCNPHSRRMLKLAEASQGALTYAQVREHFYPLKVLS